MALGCVPGANLDGFWLQKSTKICSWTALGPSCGRLGPSWAVLEGSWDVLKRHRKMMQKKSAQKVGKKCVFRRLGGRFGWPRPPWFHNPERTFFDALTDPRSGGGWAGILAEFLGGRRRFWKNFWEGWNRFLRAFWYTFFATFSHHVLCMMVSRVHGRIMYFTYFGLLQTLFLTLDAVDAFKHWSLDTALGLQDF